MRKTMFVAIAAACITYAIYALIKKIVSIIKWMRLQRRINKVNAYTFSDEGRAEIEKFAREVAEALDIEHWDL